MKTKPCFRITETTIIFPELRETSAPTHTHTPDQQQNRSLTRVCSSAESDRSVWLWLYNVRLIRWARAPLFIDAGVCVCVCVCVCAPRSGADAGDCEDGGQWVSKVVFSPDHGRVPLSDGDVVGGSLAVHAGHREPCGDKTQQSEHTRLQMPKRCGSPHEHLHGEQSTEKHGETQTKRWRAREIRGITGDWRNCDPARALLPFTDTHTHTHTRYTGYTGALLPPSRESRYRLSRQQRARLFSVGLTKARDQAHVNEEIHYRIIIITDFRSYAYVTG